MINWSFRTASGDRAKNPFWSPAQLKELTEYLTNMGFMGSHEVMCEGYQEEGISYSEGSISGEDYAEEMRVFWVELLEEAVYISPQGFDYPLNRADQSNVKQGYKNAINNQKAGNYFVETVKEMLEETLYNLDTMEWGKNNWTYRIKPWAIKVVDAGGAIDSKTDRNDWEVKMGSLSWTIDIDPMGIYKEVEE